MVVPENEKVVKCVSRKLKHYFEVKRLEDGFDLSGVDVPKQNHPKLKARSTLNYDGLHDKPLKHYFGDHGVRVRLTNFVAPPNDPKQKTVKKKMVHYMDTMKFVHPYLPEYSYIHYPRGKMILRPDYQGFGLQLPKTKTPHRGGYPVLRATPSHQISKGEAKRLVNTTSRLLVSSQCVDGSERDQRRSRSLSRDGRRSSSRSASGRRSTRPKNVGNGRATSAKNGRYVYDIDGRRVKADPGAANGQEDDDDDNRKEKPMPHWLRNEIKKRDKQDGEDVQQRYVRPGSSISGGSGRPTSRTENPRPSSRTENARPSSRDGPRRRTSADRNVSENTGVQTDLDLIRPERVNDRIVTSGVRSKYRVFVRTGTKLGASTTADVFITLYGTKGRSEEIVLMESKSHKATFKKNQLTGSGDMPLSRLVWIDALQEDEFHISTYHVGELQQIRIGHNRKDLGASWYLESVSVIDLHDRVSYLFMCKRWLSFREEDKCTKRVLQGPKARNLPPDSELTDSDDSRSRSPSPMYSSPSTTRSPSPQRQGARSPTPLGGRPASAHSSLHANASRDGRAPPEDDVDFSESDDDGDDKSRPTRVPVDVIVHTNSSNERSSPSNDYAKGYKDGLAEARASSPAKDQHLATPSDRAHSANSNDTRADDYCIHTAAQEGRLKLVQDILQKNPHLLNAESEADGYTAMHLAAQNGHTELVKWLAVQCADMKARTKRGYHVTHMAAESGHLDCLKLLSALGAQLNVKTADNRTLLHSAAAGGHKDCCHWLVKNDVDPKLKDDSNRTALDLARTADHQAVVDFLEPLSGKSARKSDEDDETLAVISEESISSNQITSSRVAEPSQSYAGGYDEGGTICSEGTDDYSTSTPRINLTREDPMKHF